MRGRHLFAVAVLATSCFATAQMAGRYTIDPAGSGTRNFRTFLDAAKALFVQNVSGPVEFLITPGNYSESFFLLPVQGVSSTNTIKFFTPVPGTVKLSGNPADTLSFINGFSWFLTSWYIFDGIEFVTAPGYAVRGGGYTQDIEFTNCTFQAAHVGTTFPQSMWYVEGANTALRWKVHHNKFIMPGSPSQSRYGLYLSQIGQWDIHTNDIDLNNTGNGLYLINLNDARNRIYNNLIYGTLYNAAGSTAINVALSNLNNDIAHNTLLVTTGTAGGNVIATFGLAPQNFNRIYGNILGLIGTGTCINVNSTSTTLQVWDSNGNIFFAPQGDVGKVGAAIHTTLSAWQTATNKDAQSVAGDPQFVNASTQPYDFHVRPTSPAKDAAANTPTFVTMDYDGRFRDAKPDIGAYELGGGFATFGQGCPGSGNAIPVIGSTGSVALGSTNFAVTVSQGLGGAPALLALGGSKTRWGAVTLPFDIGGGCAVRVSIALLFTRGLAGTGAGNGTASVAIPIPNDTALLNASVFFQWFIIDSGSSSPFGITTSNAGAAQL